MFVDSFFCSGGNTLRNGLTLQSSSSPSTNRSSSWKLPLFWLL
jgi:hypothetical protein